MPVWPGWVGVCGGLAVARRGRASDRVTVGGCHHDWHGVDADCRNHERIAAGADVDESD